MFFTFLSHLSKRLSRSSSVGKEVAIQIVLGLIIVLIAGYSLAAGFALEKIMVDVLKQPKTVFFLNGLLIYYFLGGFMTRYLMQSVPALDAKPYLHLPIPKSSIVNFLLGKSLLHVFNFFIFLVFAPFAFTVIVREYGILPAVCWLLSIWLISLINHFLVILVKRYFTESILGFILFLVVTLLFSAADYYGWIKLSIASEKFFNATLNGYPPIGILLLLTVLLYYSTYRVFINRLYPEELAVKENQSVQSIDWAFLQNFGLVGSWINVEVKLIFRNKRSRELFIMHVVFFLAPLIFYIKTNSQGPYASFLFFGLISSGFFLMNYGQFLFGWQAGHFDLTLTQPTSIRQFVESKYLLLTSITAIWFLCSIPFVFFGWHLLFVNLAATLYNIGINIFIVMNMSLWGAKKIDLMHPGSLNLEGMGAAQWLMGFPLMASPYVFYLPFSLMGYSTTGILAVGVAGLLGIMFRHKLMDITTQRITNRRYLLSSNFRKE